MISPLLKKKRRTIEPLITLSLNNSELIDSSEFISPTEILAITIEVINALATPNSIPRNLLSLSSTGNFTIKSRIKVIIFKIKREPTNNIIAAITVLIALAVGVAIISEILFIASGSESDFKKLL